MREIVSASLVGLYAVLQVAVLVLPRHPPFGGWHCLVRLHLGLLSASLSLFRAGVRGGSPGEPHASMGPAPALRPPRLHALRPDGLGWGVAELVRIAAKLGTGSERG